MHKATLIISSKSCKSQNAQIRTSRARQKVTEKKAACVRECPSTKAKNTLSFIEALLPVFSSTVESSSVVENREECWERRGISSILVFCWRASPTPFSLPLPASLSPLVGSTHNSVLWARRALPGRKEKGAHTTFYRRNQ